MEQRAVFGDADWDELMLLYTTYFARLKKLPSDIIPVSICGKAPDWYTGIQYKKLAPKYDFFMKWKTDHDNNSYIDSFNTRVLKELTTDQVLADLTTLTNNAKKVALVCYEKPDDFCHRHLVADWFKQHMITCIEWRDEFAIQI